MSFNRLNYDMCAEKQSIKQSKGPGLYNVNTPVDCNQCHQTNPMVINQRGGTSLNTGVDWRFYTGPVDVESELMGVNRPASRCPKQQYEPFCTRGCGAASGYPCGQGVESCHDPALRTPGKREGDNNLADFQNCYLPTDSTRLSNPPSTLRGTGINRFAPLCVDPQAQVMFPGQYNIPTRLVVKDNHRACIPNLSVMERGLPPPRRPITQCETTPVPVNPISPGYQYDVCG